jgi:hypothetical protein
MKKTIQLLAIGATVAIFTLPVAARNLLSQPETVLQDQCTQENKDAWYASFIEIRKTDETKAYDIAKKYLTCAAAEDNKITQYLKKWVDSYEKGNRKAKLSQFLAEKKYADAFAIGKDILTDEPENVKVLIDMGYGGYVASAAKNTTFNADAINYAKKAIQLIESGKAPDSWAPFAGKDDALAYLNYSIGVMTLPQDRSAALSYLIKAAQFESNLKKSPLTYAYIAGAYEEGPYAKQSADYERLYKGKDETPESKLALANINQLVDRIIDAYARAVALAATDPKFAASKPAWVEALTNLYKYRHDKSDAGMNELVASVLSKPLPPEPTPITSLPASAPATTPATGPGNGASSTGTLPTGTTVNKPAGATNTPATTTPAASKTPTPAPSPTKKPRRNHKRN